MAKKLGQIDFKEIWTIPNIITYFRILCVPVFVTLMALAGVRDDFTLFYVALGVFFLASGSDMVDGWIARKFNMQSGIGMVLDPIADKLMHVSVLACLAFCTGLTPLGQNLVANGTLSNPWFVHYAFVILIFAKEFIQAMIALYVLKKGRNGQGELARQGILVHNIRGRYTRIFPQLRSICRLGYSRMGYRAQLRRRFQLSERDHETSQTCQRGQIASGYGGIR